MVKCSETLTLYKRGAMLVPYIGITDFTSFEQVEEMRRVHEESISMWSKRVLHAGVMMSYKTLLGLPTKWEITFPLKESIAEIFAYTSGEVYNCLHYADYDNNSDLEKCLISALNFAGCGLTALQLDMPWPQPEEVGRAVWKVKPEAEVILQIGERALVEASNDPRIVVRSLERYKGVIDRVLLDKSMGKGRLIDAGFLLPFARAIRDKWHDLSIGFAGGLGPETLDLIDPILEEFPYASFDAQSRLRPSHNALDPVDWSMAREYLERFNEKEARLLAA